MKPATHKRIPNLQSPDTQRVRRRFVLLCLIAAALVVGGVAVGRLTSSQVMDIFVAQPRSPALSSPESSSTLPSVLTVQQLLDMPGDVLDRVDSLDVDLAVARSIPGCESLDVDLYRRTLDEWEY